MLAGGNKSWQSGREMHAANNTPLSYHSSRLIRSETASTQRDIQACGETSLEKSQFKFYEVFRCILSTK